MIDYDKTLERELNNTYRKLSIEIITKRIELATLEHKRDLLIKEMNETTLRIQLQEKNGLR